VPESGRAVPVRVLPAVADPRGRVLTQDELAADDHLCENVRRVLDERSLLGTCADVTPARFAPVAAMVHVRRRPGTTRDEVRATIARALCDHLNPLVGPEGNGWPWGGTFRPEELLPVVRRLPGVESIETLRCYEAALPSLFATAREIVNPLTIPPDALVISGQHEVRVDP
jgi:hypothetical protein